MRWLIAAGLILSCCCYRWLLYHRRLRFLSDYKRDLLLWVATNNSAASSRLVQDVLFARDLLKTARVTIALPRVEPLGLSQIATMQLRPLDRVRTHDVEVVMLNLAGLDEAQGYFKRRRNESFDPMFWVDYFLRLPAYLFPVLERGPDLVKHIVQLLWYGTVLYGAFRAGTFDALLYALKQLAL